MNYILIVEDNPEMAALLATLLHRQYPGAEIASCTRIHEAHNILMHEQPWDLVIVDGHLPDGDGAQLVECIVKAYGGPPFLGISGSLDALEELGMAGCRAVLAKPFEAAALFLAIEAMGVGMAEEEGEESLTPGVNIQGTPAAGGAR